MLNLPAGRIATPLSRGPEGLLGAPCAIDGDQRFREMLDALPAAIYTTDARGRLTHYNRACVAFSGRTPELGSDHWCVTWKLYYPDGRPMPHDECPMAIALKEGRVIRGAEAIAERPDGTRLWFMPHPTPLRDEQGRVVGGINMLVDITERKHAEQASARLAAIVESSDDAIISKDLTGIITSWNGGAERLFGYTVGEAIGRPVTMLMPPDRVNEELVLLERIRRGERIHHYETVRRRKDGTLLDISLTVSPVFDARGVVVGASKVARDITERKRADERLERALARRTEEVTRAERALANAGRMAAVGTLASGLAHDIANVLMPLGTRLDALLVHSSVDGATHDHLVAIQGLMIHLREMSRNLSLFARDPEQEGLVGNTDLAQWCARAWRFIEKSIQGSAGAALPEAPAAGGGGVPIRLDCDIPKAPPPPPVAIAPHRLTQVVLNLVQNAQQAILARRPAQDAKGSLPVGRIEVSARASGDDSVVLRVTDNGCGMDAEVKRRAVEPFFTTKNRPGYAGAPGSGQGLALVHGVIERIGGSMQIESEVDRGTTITLTLPVVKPD